MHTFNNWYQWEWSIGGKNQVSPFDQWLFKPKNIGLDSSLTFKESVEKALYLISKTRNAPLGIMYSGGLDSEIILQTALDLDIPINVFSIRFCNNLNNHEMQYVKEFSEKNKIKINYIDVDIENWLYKEEYELSYPYQVRTYHYAHIATPLHFFARNFIANQYGDYAIINGSGDVPLALLPKKLDCTKNEWGISINWDSQFNRLNQSTIYPEDIPLFFCYIPELQYNFLMEQEILQCVNPAYKKCGVISSRHNLYHRLWPQLLRRQKYDGFEYVKSLRNVVRYKKLELESCTWYTYNEYLQFYRNFT